jgi:hypothetical protein
MQINLLFFDVFVKNRHFRTRVLLFFCNFVEKNDRLRLTEERPPSADRRQTAGAKRLLWAFDD